MKRWIAAVAAGSAVSLATLVRFGDEFADVFRLADDAARSTDDFGRLARHMPEEQVAALSHAGRLNIRTSQDFIQFVSAHLPTETALLRATSPSRSTASFVDIQDQTIRLIQRFDNYGTDNAVQIVYGIHDNLNFPSLIEIYLRMENGLSNCQTARCLFIDYIKNQEPALYLFLLSTIPPNSTEGISSVSIVNNYIIPRYLLYYFSNSNRHTAEHIVWLRDTEYQRILSLPNPLDECPPSISMWSGVMTRHGWGEAKWNLIDLDFLIELHTSTRDINPYNGRYNNTESDEMLEIYNEEINYISERVDFNYIGLPDDEWSSAIQWSSYRFSNINRHYCDIAFHTLVYRSQLSQQIYSDYIVWINNRIANNFANSR
ncbi:hypothetical protein HXX25_07915 [Hyphobacterium sp. CCMP332]|uniref:hypothetical protein n=1 Tax=Hyphobacterium sp. CCMP332 TaxID=2749086 RepID=UPI0016502D62|nr:hypothetical protein [Hyphobacterium sp. CCMP332]QNL19243.1 hypothetical protein HXX25_07915 [Hyphobacterium sp. CCMP332]